MRLAFVTTGLGAGGAEMMLFKLLTRLDPQRFTPAVFSLRGEEVFAQRLRDQGIAVHLAGLGSSGGLRGLVRLRQALAAFQPDLLQGWMYHGSVAAWLADRTISQRRPVLFGIRQSLYDIGDERRTTALVIRLAAALSGRATHVVYNSRQGQAHHEAFGFDPARSVYVPNGFETDTFVPSGAARQEVRAELGLAPGTPLAGFVARYHPVKDHAGLLAAAARVRQVLPAVHFVLAGSGVDADNPVLMQHVLQHGLGDRVHLLGARRDVPRITAALDVAVCASQAEGFPNVVGEAMSCGVPCVVTEVGDCRDIVGTTGAVVRPRDPAAMADGLVRLLSLAPDARAALGLAARERVKALYSIEAVVRQYTDLYLKVQSMSALCAA